MKIDEKFIEIVKKINDDTSYSSKILDRVRHPLFQELLNKSEEYIPMALTLLKKKVNSEGAFPLVLLPFMHKSTKSNPIPKEDEGKISDMCKHWVNWGRQNGLIDQENIEDEK